MDATRLSGKIAVITGATTGIGQATARRFLEEGATVITADRSPQRNPLIAEAHENVTGIACDVTRPEDIENLAHEVRERFGRVDILVNNAGVTGMAAPTHEYPLDEYERVMNTNVRGPWLMMRALIPLMLGGGGSIVNVSSIGAVTYAPGSSPYPPSKAAVVMMTKEIAIEYVSQGIRANAVLPGLIDTPILGDATDTRDFLATTVPLGRLGTPEEVAALIAYLASDEAAFTTGSAYLIDGGHTAV